MDPGRLETLLAALPVDSPFRPALRALNSADPATRRRAVELLAPLRRPMWEPPVVLDEPHALAAIRTILELEMPDDDSPLSFGPGVAVIPLIGSAYPSVLALVEDRYRIVPQRMLPDYLTLVASSPAREAAEMFVRLVKARGWPSSWHRRFVFELSKHVEHGDLLFPELLELGGIPLVDIGDLLLGCLRSGTVVPGAIEQTPLARELPARIEAALGVPIALRNAEGLDDGDHETRRAETAILVALAAYVRSPDVVALLRRATSLTDARVAAFAIASLRRRGEEVEPTAIARVASDFGALNTLHAELASLGQTGLIPPTLRTRERFAHADLAEWLAHPGELGRLPDEVETMSVLPLNEEEGDMRGVAYVLRFRVGDDPWLAALAGPYRDDAPEGPVAGASTFSRFEEWGSASLDEHVDALLETLDSWRRVQLH